MTANVIHNKPLASRRHAPGPKGHFFVGSLPDFSRDPLGFLDLCAREYGDVVEMRVPNQLAFVVYHPDQIEELLVAKSRNFIKAESLRLRPFRLLLGNGLLTSEGDFWRRQRRLAQPAFHRERIAGYADAMVGYTRRMLDTWKAGQTLDVHREMMRLTLEVVAKTLFDAEIAGDAEDVGEALEVAMDRFSSQGSLVRALDNYLPTPGWLRLKRAAARLDRLIYGMIEQKRKSNRAGDDLLSMLLAARDEDGSHMTDKQLRDEALTLFLAGHETTALALSWTFYLLGQNPEVETRLADEVRSVLAGREPGAADVTRLQYTGQVIKETMRLYPPAWSIGREAIEDCEIGGYYVPARSQVFAVQWTTHRDPRFFNAPGEFNPGRWTEDFEKNLPRFAYMPFGGGARICIGNQFAMMEAVLILATVIQRFSLELVPGQTVTPWPSITLRPASGIRVSLHQR